MNWDVTYWAQRQQKALFNLTDEEVRPYFVYDNVPEGAFPGEAKGRRRLK